MADGARWPATVPRTRSAQCRGSVLKSALTSLPPHDLAVARLTNSTGLSSAAVV